MKEAGVETLRLDPAEPRNVTVGQPPELGATDAPRPAWAAPSPPARVESGETARTGRGRQVCAVRPQLCLGAGLPLDASLSLVMLSWKSGLSLQRSLYAVWSELGLPSLAGSKRHTCTCAMVVNDKPQL